MNHTEREDVLSNILTLTYLASLVVVVSLTTLYLNVEIGDRQSQVSIVSSN